METLSQVVPTCIFLIGQCSCREEPAKGACHIRSSWSGLASEGVETELKAIDGLNGLAWTGGT